MAGEFQGVAAAILAGGLGTRLRPAVGDRPKVLAPVAGEPFLAHLLRQIARGGIREAVLLVGHGAEQVRTAFGDSTFGVSIRYSTERELLGTGGAIRLALPLLHGSSVLVMNGDSYCNVDLPGLIRSHRERRSSATLTLTQVENASRFGRVVQDPDERITRFEEKDPRPSPGWINAGIYMLETALLEAIQPNRVISLERDLLPGWIAGHEVRGYLGGEFINIGVPESYARAEAFFRALNVSEIAV